MKKWFYDNAIELSGDDSQMTRIDRIYCLDFEAFSQEDWDELSRIYDELPGTRLEKGVPYWFGVDETNPPYLSVSVEPPGLQVAGVLRADDWAQWDEIFRTHVEKSSLPVYEI